MKDIRQIHHDIIRPLGFYGKNNPKSPTIEELGEYSQKLEVLIMGMVIGADLSGDKIDRLSKEIRKLNKKK